MVRPHRVEYEGAYYHVMNRGRGRQNIYHDAKYFEAFEGCLEQAHRRFGLEVHAYCLMNNHYHLLVRTPRGNLSRAMRHVNGVYTQYYNRHKKTDGTLFRGRYKAINIEASSYLLEVSRYIHRNPVETKKPIVSRLEDYKWSSYPCYRNKNKSPDWLYKESVFSELGSGQPTAAYGRFVEHGVDDETEKFYEKNHWPAVRGSKRFIDKAHLHSVNNGREVPRDKPVKEIVEVIEAVVHRTGLSEQEIFKSSRGKGNKNITRWMAMKLCQDYTGLSLKELASEFKVGSYSTVSATVGRFNRLVVSDKSTAELYDRICKDLSG